MAELNRFDTIQYISNVERSVCKPSVHVVRSYIRHCNANLNEVLKLHCNHEKYTLMDLMDTFT